MQKLKVALKVLNSKSKIEKILIRVTNETNLDISPEKQIAPIVHALNNPASLEDQSHSLEIFNNYLRNVKGWIPAFKLLYISHELINKVGPRFCTSFMSDYFQRIPDMMKGKNDVEDYVHAVLAANYYNFLIMYAKYFPDIQAHLQKEPSDLLEGLQNGQYSGIIQLISFKNAINYFTKVVECISGSANVLKEEGLVFKIKVALTRDIVIIYNLISKTLRYLMPHIFDLDDHLAILLDDLYSDIIQTTNKLKQIIKKENLEGIGQIKSFDFYQFDSEFNKEVELYILDVKKSRAKKGKDEKVEPHIAYMNKYQTLTPGKKLYKMNSKGDHFAAVQEDTQPLKNRATEYFNLASPEPSHLDEESLTPVKHEINGDESDDKSSQPEQGIMLLTDNDTQLYRDITSTMKYQVSPSLKGLNSFRGFEMNNADNFAEPGSVIFSPTVQTTVVNGRDDLYHVKNSGFGKGDNKFDNNRKFNLNMNNY